MLNHRLTWYQAFTTLLALSSTAVLAEEGPRQVSDQWVWNAAGGSVYQFSANLSDGSGDLSIARGFLSAGLGYAWSRDATASVSFGIGTTDYDFSSGTRIEGRKPWGRIQDYRLSVPVRFSPIERIRALLFRVFAPTQNRGPASAMVAQRV
jgi:hypothetical protein